MYSMFRLQQLGLKSLFIKLYRLIEILVNFAFSGIYDQIIDRPFILFDFAEEFLQFSKFFRCEFQLISGLVQLDLNLTEIAFVVVSLVDELFKPSILPKLKC